MSADPDALAITVRDKIVDLINAETYTGHPFEATANYLPEYRLATLSILQVDVRIVNDDTEVIDRFPSSEDVYHLEITLQKQCSSGDATTLDELVNRGKRIAKLFYVNRELSGITPVPVVVENSHELYDPFMLREYAVFFSRIELAVRQYVTD